MEDERPDGDERSRWEPAPGLVGGGSVEEPTVTQPTVEGERTGPLDVDPPVASALPGPPPGPPRPPGPPAPPSPLPPSPAAPAPVGPDESRATGPTEGPPDAASTRERRLKVAAVVLAVLAIAVVVAVVVTSGGSGKPVRATTTSVPTTTSTTLVQGEIELLAGVRAIVPPGSLTPGATPVAELVEPKGDLGAMTPAGPVVDLSIEKGQMLAPIRLVFTLSNARTAPTGGDPVVVGLLQQDGTDEFRSGKLTGAPATFEVEVDAPGTVAPLTWRWEELTDKARTAFRDLADSGASAPADGTCAQDLDPVEVGDSTEGTVTWCAEASDDSRRVVAVNTAGFPVTVSWTGNATAVRDVGTGDDSGISAGFASWTTDSAMTLSPGERATFSVAATEQVTFESELDDTARAAAALVADVDFLVALAEAVPAAENPERQVVIDGIDPSCAAGETSASGVLGSCFDSASLRAIFGSTAGDLMVPLVKPKVLGTAADDAQRSVATTMERRARGSLTLQPREVHEWPTGEDSAVPALLTWLDDIGETYEWARCVDDYCVAGVGGRVAVVQIEGGEVVRSGGVDLDSADPMEALTAIGIPESVADVLTAT